MSGPITTKCTSCHVEFIGQLEHGLCGNCFRREKALRCGLPIPNWQDIGDEPLISYGDPAFDELDDKPMTKREQIAAMMMQGLITASPQIDDMKAASWAVDSADALIAELKRRKEPTE